MTSISTALLSYCFARKRALLAVLMGFEGGAWLAAIQLGLEDMEGRQRTFRLLVDIV
jgi:hypothetical protein